MTMLRLICTLLLFCAHQFLTNAFGQRAFDETRPTPHFAFSAEFGAGPFYSWNIREDLTLERVGLILRADRAKFGTSYRFSLSRHTRSNKYSFGASFYSYSARKVYDENLLSVDEEVLVLLEEFKLGEVGNAFTLNFSPRLYSSGRASVYGDLGLGIVYLELSDVEVSELGGTVYLRTRKFSNAWMSEALVSAGLSAHYQVNPFYRVFVRGRYNYELSTNLTLLIEGAVGVEFALKKGGIHVQRGGSNQ